MKKNHNTRKTEVSNHPVPESNSVSSNRRRFVKNSAISVPMVLTLRSGAGVAEAMVSHDCAKKDQTRAAELDAIGDLREFSESMVDGPFLRTETICCRLWEVVQAWELINNGTQDDTRWVVKQDVTGGAIEVDIFQSAPWDMGPGGLWLTKTEPREKVIEAEKPVAVYNLLTDSNPMFTAKKFTMTDRNFILYAELGTFYGLLGVNLWGEVVMVDGHVPVGKFTSGEELTNITASCIASINPDEDFNFED